MKFLILLIVLLCLKENVHSVENEEIEPSKSIVWGPGLNPEKIPMGARYFFLQLVDSSGKNLTESPGKGTVSAQVQGFTEDGHKCPAWVQELDNKDGSFIIRYRIHKTCLSLKTTVKINKQDVPLPQSFFDGPVYEEDCYCPEASMETFLQTYQCQQNYSQMQHDLSFFPTVNFNRIREKLIKRYHRPDSVSICNYVIKKNKIYRRCYGQHVGFKIFMDSILLSLARKVVLPDVEFFVNLGDWPLVPKDRELMPMFSWCGSHETRDIVMPTYDITGSSLEAMRKVVLDMLSVQSNAESTWEEKIEKVFWRGRDSRRERLDLIDIAKKNPSLFNASITNFFFFKNEVEKYGPGSPHVSFFSFFKYKYQLNIDGTVAAYRFPYLLAGDSLVLKQDSNYYEFFYRDLQPGVHYVPVQRDLSDLVDKVKWAMQNDEEALKITKKARQFVRDNLLPHNIFCYHLVLLNEWNKRLESQVKVLDNMEEVPQPNHHCKCYNNYAKDEL